VNAVNELGETALHGAAYFGCDALVEYLASHGANLNIQDKRRWTALTIIEGVNRNPSLSNDRRAAQETGRRPDAVRRRAHSGEGRPESPVPKEEKPDAPLAPQTISPQTK
jgi:ankyrin repeat protein